MGEGTMDDAAEKARRKERAPLPFPEKIKILKKLREVNRNASQSGLRKLKASKPR
jgi:hypothetical protein